MDDLSVPSRRGFIAACGVFLAAPAIVRVTSLMPVRDWKIYGPDGILSLDMLTDEMSRLLKPYTFLVNELDPLRLVIDHNLKQKAISMELSVYDRKLALEDFSRRILQPSAQVLGECVKVINGAPVELTVDSFVLETARADNVRGAITYDPITNRIITRFDVLTS